MAIGTPKSLSECKRFFCEPSSPKQRQYEALRAYFAEERPSAEVARTFGYTPGSFQVMCHHFRREENPSFFLTPQTGPHAQPQKSAARDLIIELRKNNHSIYEISAILKSKETPLSPTAVREVLKAEGFAALPRRLDENVPMGFVRLSKPSPMSANSPLPLAASRRSVVVSSCLCLASSRSTSRASPKQLAFLGRR